MGLNKFIRDLLFILFALYYAQGWLYASGSFISQSCFLVIILISLVYMVKTLLLIDWNNSFIVAWTIFIVLNLAGFIYNPDISQGHVRNAIKNTLGCMLPLYPFYYFAMAGELKAKHLILFSVVLFPLIVWQYFFTESDFFSRSDTTGTEMVNNWAYMFAGLIPFIFLIKKRLVAILLMLMIVTFVINGAKRGAIVTASIGMIMYFYYQLRTIEKQHKFFGYASILVVILILCFFAYLTFMSNSFIMNRMTSLLEGDLSNRNFIYTSILKNWYSSDNILNFLFGYGLAGSIGLSGGHLAHNDWLELLSNFGVTGVLAYVFLFYAAFKLSLNNEWNLDKKILFLTIVVMWFFITLVSMFYRSVENFPYTILLGYLIGTKGSGLE